MEEFGESKFSAKLLVDGLMESNFGSSPQEWSEIVRLEKLVDKSGILLPDGRGFYYAPSIDMLRKALDGGEEQRSQPKNARAILEEERAKLEILKSDISLFEASDDYAALRDHLEMVNRLASEFDRAFQDIEKALAAAKPAAVSEVLDRLGSLVPSSAPPDEDCAGSRSALTTVFKVEQGGVPVPKNFSSPAYDMVRNALNDLREGKIGDDDFTETVQQACAHIMEFIDFCTGELEWIKENEPEEYALFKDVGAALARTHKSCAEGSQRILDYFQDRREQDMEQGMEIFFRGIQEMAAVYVMLDYLKKNGY